MKGQTRTKQMEGSLGMFNSIHHETVPNTRDNGVLGFLLCKIFSVF